MTDTSRPAELGKHMSSDAHEELYRLLLDTANECPLPVLGNCLELLATVVAKRLHDETGEVLV